MAEKEAVLRSLKILLPKGQVFTDKASLIAYEADAGIDKGLPDAVVLPRNTEEVQRIVRWAGEQRVALIARGAGTGLSGGAVAERGGIIVDFARMNRLLAIDSYERSAVVEPALSNLRLDEQASMLGLYFPPDPSSQRASTIGGNVAENAGGPHCFKYGVTTNYVTGLKVVLADGQLVRVGGRALDYPGYDLVGLITGSEGTLGLITAISVRLLRHPPAVKTMLAVFETTKQAGHAVSAIISAGLVPATMEMMEQKIIRIIEPFAKAGLPLDAGAILIIEVDGHPQSLDMQIAEIAQILRKYAVREIKFAHSAQERNRIWLARKSAAGAVTRLAPSYYTVDVTVPRSSLTEMLVQVDAICERHALQTGYLMHAGDGNLHPLILVPEPENSELMHHVHEAGWEIVKCCVAMGGSITGEHGVGIEKRAYMSLMHNTAELMAMWDVKAAFDPLGLFNPGKIFPSATKHEHISYSHDDLPDTAYNGRVSLHWGASPLTPPGHPQGMPLHWGASPLTPPGHPQGMPLHWGASPLPPPGHPQGMPLQWYEHASQDDPSSIVGASLVGALGGEGRCPPMQADPNSPLPGPGETFTPTSVQEAAQGLRALGNAGLRAQIGAVHAGQQKYVQISTSGLSGIKTYAPDDLYITVGAGTKLVDIQSFLAEHGKQLALASPWPATTIGGLVAANVNAPQRMLYGALRDMVLYTTVALADGRVIRTGRPLVKNVAGYDLTKVFVGSHGTLGLIADVTLKFVVPARTRRTLLMPIDDLRQGLIWSQQLLPIALVASAIILCKGYQVSNMPASNYLLAYTAEGLSSAVEAELAHVRQTLEVVGGPEPYESDTLSGTAIWCAMLGEAIMHQDLLVRVGVPAGDLLSYLQDQSIQLHAGSFIADMSSGLVYVMPGMSEVGDTHTWLSGLRQLALAMGGYALVMSEPEAFAGKLARWGYEPEGWRVMEALRRRWDPAGVLVSAAPFLP
ncbi:MAG: FAD-binding protein [Chloroflexi bacterium]|nr:MAG: FAD-binding protein [Chloroflexota bacterium]